MYQKLSKNIKWCLYLSSFITTVVLLGIFNSIYIIFKGDIPTEYIELGEIIFILINLLSVIELLFVPYFRYKRYKYIINDDKIDVVEGVLFIKRTIVPINRIQKVELSRGPIDSLFKVSKVTITTAGGDVIIKFLDIDVAENVANKLKDKINELVLLKEANYGE